MTIRLVAWREITERVRGRAFLIATAAIVALVLEACSCPRSRTTRRTCASASAAPPRPR